MEGGSPLITMAETAELLRYSYDGFRTRWKVLNREQDFPAPAMARPYRWDGEAVRRWIARRSNRIVMPPDASSSVSVSSHDEATVDGKIARDGRARLRLLKGYAA